MSRVSQQILVFSTQTLTSVTVKGYRETKDPLLHFIQSPIPLIKASLKIGKVGGLFYREHLFIALVWSPQTKKIRPAAVGR